MHRLLEDRCSVQMLADICPWGQLGKGVMILCDRLYITLYISSKTQFKLMMDEVA